jgi:hypothetical protein
MMTSLKLKPGKQRLDSYVSGRKKVSKPIIIPISVQYMVLFVKPVDVLSCKLGCVRKTKLSKIQSNSVPDSRFINKHFSTYNN